MQKQTRYNFTPVHMNLLEQFQNLFNRQNLCSNNYLYRQINQNFELPLIIITEQRKISQISHNSQTIQEALEMCNLVELIDNKTVRIHEFPTVKIANQHKINVEELSKILKQKNKKILVYEEDNNIILTLLQTKANKQLEKIIQDFDKNLEYKVADLHTDWKIGTGKIRKLKQQNKKSYKQQKYSFDKPPGIFIRRAVESSDQEQESHPNKKYSNQKKDEKEKQKQKEKKYRQKPIINEQDFPTLS